MIDDLYASAFSVEAFTQWTITALGPHGFDAANTLPLVGLCRDEVMFPIEQAMHEAWGLPFDLSSLGGMMFLGRTGLSAAAHHAPGVDGRRRFLCIVLPHIGLDAAHGAGFMRREGIDEPSSACGALIALCNELAAGERHDQLDHDDLEMSLLRMTLLPLIPVGQTPDLSELTELARRTATDELVRLVGGLLESPNADVATVSGLAIHGPEGDRVAVGEAWVRIGSGTPVALGAG